MFKKFSILFPILFCVFFFKMAGKSFAGTSTETIKAIAPNASGLVGHYEFEGNTKDSAGTNHGTLYGNPTYGTGVFGQAINLDGDGDYINCGKATSFDLVKQITVTAWIKVSMFDKQYQTIISKGDNSWRLGRAGSTNNIEFACNGTAITRWTGWGEVPWSVLGTNSVYDGKWHHIAGVFDGTGLFFYIDGVLEAAKSAGNSIDVSNYDMCIGTNAQVPGREWNGLIDDVRIYNYALSQTEIVSLVGKSEIILALPVPTTLYDISKRYDGLNKLEEAKGVCQLILQHYSDSLSASGAQIYISKRDIISFIESKNFDQTKVELDKLISTSNDHPDLPEALFTIAVSYGWAKKYEEAENIYKRIIQQSPDSSYAEQARFRAPSSHISSLILSGDYTEAQTSIDKFVGDFPINPSTAGAVYWFGKEFEALMRYKEAKSVFQKVITSFPDNAHTSKAEVRVPKMDALSLIESGNDSEAQTTIDSLIVDFRDHPDLPEEIFSIGEKYYHKAFQYEQDGLKAEALDCFKKALGVWEKIITQLPSSAPNTARAYNFGADCYRRLGKYQKAIEYYQMVVDDWPDYEYAWNAQFLIGRTYENLKESGLISKLEADLKTKAAYEQILKKYPECKAARIAQRWLASYK